MGDNNLKEWTLLIYANGNNELAPETWQSILSIESDTLDTSNVNVIIQVSRELEEVINILRPNQLFTFKPNEEYWCGTRRYKIIDGKLELLDTLGEINMASPKNVKDFITWATSNYPAKRYALSIGGHIYQLTGILPDYSQDKPYLAGFPELALAINTACKENNIVLDVLILDTCFANSVEVMYEFGKDKDNLIKYILSYIGKGPLRGLPYIDIIELINKFIDKSNEEVLREIIDDLSSLDYYLDLIAIRLDYDLINEMKITFHNIAFLYLQNKDILEKPLEPYEILSTYDKSLPWIKHLLYINIAYSEIILYYKFSNCDTNDTIPIYILNKFIPNVERQEIYYRLSFCKDNYWFNLLSNIDPHSPIPFDSSEVKLEPIPLSKNILYSFVYTVNDYLSDEENELIINTLIELKHWELE